LFGRLQVLEGWCGAVDSRGCFGRLVGALRVLEAGAV